MPDYLAPGDEDAQGDIYDGAPLVDVRVWPMVALRRYKEVKGHVLMSAHAATGPPPRDGFNWASPAGEEVVAHGLIRRAILISHDCEIENDDRYRLIAMVRPLADIAPEVHASILAFEHAAAFPLVAQDQPAEMPLSFVDFRHITVVRPAILERCRKIASLPEQTREALAEHYWQFLFRRIVPGFSPKSEEPKA